MKVYTIDKQRIIDTSISELRGYLEEAFDRTKALGDVFMVTKHGNVVGQLGTIQPETIAFMEQQRKKEISALADEHDKGLL